MKRFALLFAFLFAIALPAQGQSVALSPSVDVQSTDTQLGAIATTPVSEAVGALAAGYYSSAKMSAYAGPTVRLYEHSQADLHAILGLGVTASTETLSPGVAGPARHATTAAVLAGFEARYEGRSIMLGVQYDTPVQYSREITQWPTAWRIVFGFGPRF